MKTQLTKRLSILGLAVICSASILTGCASSSTPVPTPEQPQSQGVAQQTSPMVESKMINVDGDRLLDLKSTRINAMHIHNPRWPSSS